MSFSRREKQGFDVAMLTLTAPHYIGDELKQLVDRLQDALAKGFRDRSGKISSKSMGLSAASEHWK